MKRGKRKPRVAPTGSIPVLKMPPKLAIPALQTLARHRDVDIRRAELLALAPSVPPRTLLNAYVLPSLTELRLFEGSLRAGRATRFGEAVARASEKEAQTLMARHLIAVDAERVNFVDWLADQSPRGQSKRTALVRFATEALGLAEGALGPSLDRLGKWAGYLIHFGVLREGNGDRGSIWSISRRHLSALLAGNKTKIPPDDELREALLGAYIRASHLLGTQLYVPIGAVRDELGQELRREGALLTDAELDEILRRAPELLDSHLVSFSPFSGPSRGGLKLDSMYAGFISVRPQRSPGAKSQRSKSMETR